MVWLYFLLLLFTDICGIALAMFLLPGLWLMLAGAAIYAWLTRADYLGYKSLIALFLLAVFAELAELVLGGAGAKKAGASKWGILGGLVGALLGGIFLTGVIPIVAPISTVIGICLGSFAGAFAVELLLGQPITKSAMIGFGAAKGRFTGIVGKIIIGSLMLVITFFAGFPIHGRQHNVTPTTAPAATAPIQ